MYGIQRKPIKTPTKTALSNPAYPMFLWLFLKRKKLVIEKSTTFTRFLLNVITETINCCSENISGSEDKSSQTQSFLIVSKIFVF